MILTLLEGRSILEVFLEDRQAPFLELHLAMDPPVCRVCRNPCPMRKELPDGNGMIIRMYAALEFRQGLAFYEAKGLGAGVEGFSPFLVMLGGDRKETYLNTCT